MSNTDFNKFKKKALLENDELFTVLFLNPISIRIAYFIHKHKLNITPNQITIFRLVFLAPLTIILLLLAPLFSLRIVYLISPILIYFILITDDLDGNLARGSGKTSKFGAFIDTISDRLLILFFFTFVFSFGLYIGSIILVYGSVILFLLKIFNLTVINKVYYYGTGKMSNEDLFSAKKETKMLGLDLARKVAFKLRRFIKIKRYGGNLGGVERMVIMVMLPSLLFYFKLGLISLYMTYIFIILFSIQYVSRTISLIRDYERGLK